MYAHNKAFFIGQPQNKCVYIVHAHCCIRAQMCARFFPLSLAFLRVHFFLHRRISCACFVKNPSYFIRQNITLHVCLIEHTIVYPPYPYNVRDSIFSSSLSSFLSFRLVVALMMIVKW